MVIVNLSQNLVVVMVLLVAVPPPNIRHGTLNARLLRVPERRYVEQGFVAAHSTSRDGFCCRQSLRTCRSRKKRRCE